MFEEEREREVDTAHGIESAKLREFLQEIQPSVSDQKLVAFKAESV